VTFVGRPRLTSKPRSTTTISDHDARHDDAEMHRGAWTVPTAYLPAVDGSALATTISSVTTTGVEKEQHNRVSISVACFTLYTDITPAKTPQAVASAPL
jgi:hypothetical protein